MAYRYRWSVELFFRRLTSIMGVRHLLSHSADGVGLQVYAALIACRRLTQATGLKPDKRTFEMFCHYFSGLASEEELIRYLTKTQEAARTKAEKEAQRSAVPDRTHESSA